ncbi:MAG: MerR family transcriptional regulator [Coriobacteriaceae bacterium]|nr:MerR family transcriptional regulator [Coriobacteriaceae bacterium]
MTYTMMQVCRELDMTYQTLKFYCNQGLAPYVKRDKNNRRVFDERAVEWIRSLTCLKRCGMSIEEMRDYLNLCLEGEKSIPRRKKMLAEKRARLDEQMEQIQASMDYIDWKQDFYDDILAGKQPYYSNLVPKPEPAPAFGPNA